MNLSPEQLPLAILVTLFVIGFLVSRLWLRRHRVRAGGHYRLLGFGMVLLAFALIGLAFTLPSEPRTWAALGFILLSFALVERTRSRLRKQLGDADHHKA